MRTVLLALALTVLAGCATRAPHAKGVDVPVTLELRERFLSRLPDAHPSYTSTAVDLHFEDPAGTRRELAPSLPVRFGTNHFSLRLAPSGRLALRLTASGGYSVDFALGTLQVPEDAAHRALMIDCTVPPGTLRWVDR